MGFVSRAGRKLEHALVAFDLDVTGRICGDLGSNVGGFVDCLLQRGAAKVYAVDTGYGVLDWKLRNDARVVVLERTNAMHVELPEKLSIVTIDVAWTRQRAILPPARRLLRQDGDIVTLVKPHYEAEPAMLRKGVLPEQRLDLVWERVKYDIAQAGCDLVRAVRSPMKGAGGNIELLAWLKPKHDETT